MVEAKRNSNRKKWIIFGVLGVAAVLIVVMIAVFFARMLIRDVGNEALGAREAHIGVLYIEGTISEDSPTYSHQYALESIDGMIENNRNKGLILFVNTPGGGVYESDELYLKIKEYQEITERPVYAYMASQATSGGYYISAGADKIIANRNCWTGSIGVTMGTVYDITGLLEKYGIKTETIDTGANKSMGSAVEPLTAQQKQIMQSLVDEAYEQFVQIVADGRNMDIGSVKKLADGRIYTAKQAQANGLIDAVSDTYDEALETMKADCGLEHCEVYEFRYEPEYGLLESFMQSMDKSSNESSQKGDLAVLSQMMKDSDKIELQYMCEVVK